MKVSVIIPTFNRANLLLEAVQSVLNQSYQDFEIIIVNDGSTDDTEQVISNYSDRIHYVKQQNAGVNAARNHALRLAQGEYIATLDNDDIWLDYKLELQVEILDKFKSAGFIYSNFYILTPDGCRTPDGLSTWHEPPINWSNMFEQNYSFKDLDLNLSIPDIPQTTPMIHVGDIYHASLYEPHVLPSTAIFRRSLLPDDIRFIEYDSICGDWDFFARLSKAHNPVFVNFETTLNRSHEDDIRLTRTDHAIQLSKRIEFIKRVWKSDELFYKDNKSSVDQTLNQTLLELSYDHILNGKADAATSAFKEMTPPLSGLSSKKLLISRMGTMLPGASQLLKLIRRMKHNLHS
jgi:glycosyltransferase involved in cell wall biosynthesis